MPIVVFLFLVYCFTATTAAAATTLPRQHTSEAGRYELELVQLETQIPLRRLHNWEIRITEKTATKTKAVIKPSQIEVDGGMPDHRHGLPSQPKVTRYLGDGRYQVQGVLFNMPGLWHLRFTLFDDTGRDQVVFKLKVQNEVKQTGDQWSAGELEVIKGLMLQPGATATTDTGNAYFNDADAVKLGKQLFFDSNLSAANIACAHCHQPQSSFADARPRSVGVNPLRRNAPSLIGVAQADWFFWDGRRDSLWSQALVPFEAPNEMASSRVFVVQQLVKKQSYRDLYSKIFGQLPDTLWLNNIESVASPVGDASARAAWKKLQQAEQYEINRHFSNIAKAIAAYEGRLRFSPSRFDQYAEQLLNNGESAAKSLLNADEQAGLRLFIGPQSQCLRCHNGPLFSNKGFHNIATGIGVNGEIDQGRALAIHEVKSNEFNCAGRYADAQNNRCEKLEYINEGEIAGLLNGAFKVPSLRNVSLTAPYMHDGRFNTLEEVMQHYRSPPNKSSQTGHHELNPLDRLNDEDIRQLIAFLKTLESPVTPN